MRLTLPIFASAALLLAAGCSMDGVSTTNKQIQSCYDTGSGYVCVDTPEGAMMQSRDVNGDLILDTFMCADEDSDSESNSISTSDSDLDSSSESTGEDDSSASESDSDDSDSDSACDGNSDSDGDGDGVENAVDCDCIGDPGDGGDGGDGGGGDGGGVPIP